MSVWSRLAVLGVRQTCGRRKGSTMAASNLHSCRRNSCQTLISDVRCALETKDFGISVDLEGEREMEKTNLGYLVENDVEAVKDLLSCDEHECSDCGFEPYRHRGGDFLCFTDKMVDWMLALHPENPQSADPATGAEGVR